MKVLSPEAIRTRVWLEAPRERVWRALTVPEQFSRWFEVTLTGEFHLDEKLEMQTATQKFFVTIETMVPLRRLRWSWHPGATDPNVRYAKEAKTLVTFELTDQGFGTLMNLCERGFAGISEKSRWTIYAKSQAAWSAHLDGLRRYLAAQIQS